jgi:hypothetical protein
MRCRGVNEILEAWGSAELPAALREHLAGCASCRAHHESREILRAGFRALAEEALPEAPIGFAARLVRRLEEAVSEPAREFLERAGRRVVYASLVLAMTVLLGLLVPPWSPLRGAAANHQTPTPQLQAAESDTVFSDEATFTVTRNSRNEPTGEGAPRNPK